jgi:hypothetical protein
MADQEFKLIISGDASGAVSAAQQASKATGGLKVDTSDLNDETKRSLGLLPQLSDGIKKGGEASENAALSSRELRKVLMDIGNVAAPGAGHAMSELAFGPVGAALALFAVYEMIQKKIEDIDAKLESLNAENLAAHKTAVENLWKAWDDARTAQQKYDIAVKEAGQSKDPAGARLAEIKAISAAQTEANLKYLEELGQLKVLWLESHGGTPEQIAAAKQSNQQAIDRAREAGANRSLDEIQADIDRRKQRQSDYDATAAAEQNRVALAEAAVKQAEENKSADNKPEAMADIQKRLDAAEANLRFAENSKDHVVVNGISYDAPGMTAAAQAARDEVQKEKDDLLRAQQADNQKLAQAEKEKTAAEAALERVTESGKANAAAVTSETQEVKTGRAVEAVKTASDKSTETLEAVKSAVDLLKGKDENQVAASGAAAMEDLNRLRLQGFDANRIKADYQQAIQDKQTPGAFSGYDQAAIARFNQMIGDQQAIAQFGELLTTMGNWGEAMKNIINTHFRRMTSLEREIKAMETVLAEHDAQIRATGVNSK